MKIDALKPCPFCGEEDDLLLMTQVIGQKERTEVFYVKCGSCTARGAGKLSRYTARAAWNTRKRRKRTEERK